jgi:hypothetical protein
VGILTVTLVFAQVHLDEAPDEWVQHSNLPTLFMQVIGQDQIICSGSFHHEQAVDTIGLQQLRNYVEQEKAANYLTLNLLYLK